MEILNAARKVTGQKIPATVGPRRAVILHFGCQFREGSRYSGMEPNYDDIDKIIETAWNWHEIIRKASVTVIDRN